MSEFHRRTLTITLDLSGRLDNISDEQLSQAIQRAANDFDDGRYIFSRELLNSGLNKIIEHAIYAILFSKATGKIPHDCNRRNALVQELTTQNYLSTHDDLKAKVTTETTHE